MGALLEKMLDIIDRRIQMADQFRGTGETDKRNTLINELESLRREIQEALTNHRKEK